MMYFLYGTDTTKSRVKLHDLLSTLALKRKDAEVFKMTVENWTETQLEELLVSQGLFEQKYIVVLDNLFEKKDVKDFVLSKRTEMAESENVFLMLEGKVDTATVEKIKKVAQKVQEFIKPEQKKESYNIFSITDGLLTRDKKKLWVSFVDLTSRGAGVEEMHGILFWQIKNMVLVSRCDSQKETGLSPYAYKNALTGSRQYSETELQTMLASLVLMTHKVRSGEGDMDVMLEKWILGV